MKEAAQPAAVSAHSVFLLLALRQDVVIGCCLRMEGYGWQYTRCSLAHRDLVPTLRSCLDEEQEGAIIGG